MMSPSTLVIRMNWSDCTVEVSVSERAGGLSSTVLRRLNKVLRSRFGFGLLSQSDSGSVSRLFRTGSVSVISLWEQHIRKHRKELNPSIAFKRRKTKYDLCSSAGRAANIWEENDVCQLRTSLWISDSGLGGDKTFLPHSLDQLWTNLTRYLTLK